MISSGCSHLELVIHESGETAMEFDAASLPADTYREFPYGDLVYVRIRIVFEDALFVKVNRNLDRFGLEGLGYDCSALPSITVESLDEDLLQFRSKWATMRSCPDSNFYVIEDSSWLKSIGDAGEGLQHFVVKGVDILIELLAKDWREVESRASQSQLLPIQLDAK